MIAREIALVQRQGWLFFTVDAHGVGLGEVGAVDLRAGDIVELADLGGAVCSGGGANDGRVQQVEGSAGRVVTGAARDALQQAVDGPLLAGEPPQAGHQQTPGLQLHVHLLGLADAMFKSLVAPQVYPESIRTNSCAVLRCRGGQIGLEPVGVDIVLPAIFAHPLPLDLHVIAVDPEHDAHESNHEVELFLGVGGGHLTSHLLAFLAGLAPVEMHSHGLVARLAPHQPVVSWAHQRRMARGLSRAHPDGEKDEGDKLQAFHLQGQGSVC